jgi:hypothetical protein
MDDLSKYEEMRKEIQAMWSGQHPWAVAIDELVAMVREAREDRKHAEALTEAYVRDCNRLSVRAEAAEAENAKLREALKPFADMWGYTDEDVKRARAALEKE